MSSAASLSVELFGRDVGLSTLLTQVDAKTQATANSALRLEAQYARLAAASGNTAQASNILSTALTNNGGASASAIAGVATQLTTLQNGGTLMQQFGASAASSLTSIIGPAALASAAIGGLIGVAKSFADAFQLKTALDQSTASIKVLLNGVRDSGETFAGAARFAQTYKLTQQETTGAIQASIPVIRNSKASIEEILGVFARLKVLKPEKTFSDAARSIGELQAGQIVSIVDQFNISRAAANKMKDEIRGGADAIGVLSNFLSSAGVGMDALAVSTQGASGAMKDVAVAQEQLALAQAQFAQGPGLILLQGQLQVTTGLTRVLSGDSQAMGAAINQAAQQGSFGFQLLNGIMGGSLAQFGQQQAAIAANAQTTAAASAESAAYSAELARTGDRVAAAAAGDAAYQAVMAGTVGVTAQAAGASGTFGAAMDTERQATASATDATTASATALVDEISKKQQSAIAAQQLAAFQASLASLGGQVASGLLTSAQAAALLASQYGITSGQARILIGLQAQLAHAPQPASFTDERGAIRANAARDQIATSVAVAKASDAKSAAEAAYQKTLGNSGPTLARIRSEMSGLVVGSTAYINKQNELEQAQQKADKAAKAGGGGAGNTKLSDQTKLNNSLLTQQEDYQKKSEDLATQYAADVEKINADFAAVTLAQQQADEISKRASQADFYDRLTSSDLNKKKTGADALKKIDADYQAAFQKSQELAQAGQPKLAADYLALKQKQADSDLSFQEKIAAAKDKKDKGEVSRLEAIQALRKAVQAEEEKQLLAAGDPNVNAKQKALDDAQQKEIDGQAKIGAASDRATARKIENATLAGKKIDEETTKVNALTDAYTRTGARAAAAGVAPGTPPATTPATTPAPGSAPDLAGAMSGLRDAIGAVESAVRSSGKGIESAVHGIHLSAPGVA